MIRQQSFITDLVLNKNKLLYFKEKRLQLDFSAEQKKKLVLNKLSIYLFIFRNRCSSGLMHHSLSSHIESEHSASTGTAVSLLLIVS